MATALVTGATGFVGANLARLLLEKGRKVKVLVRPTSVRKNIEKLDVEPLTGDLRDRDSLMSATAGCDEVYHVAAEYSFWSPNPEQMYQSNVEGTQNMMHACLKNGVAKVVYTSTVGTIGLSEQPRPCDESTPMDKGQLTSHYKRSKLEAEKAAFNFVEKGLPLVIVNPSAPIGPWDQKPTPTGKIIVDFVRGKTPAYLETGLNLIHVKDVCSGHILAAEKGRVGERYILGNENLSLGDIYKKLSQITGKPKPKLKIPYAVAFAVGLMNTKVSDWITHKPPLVPLEAVKMARRHMYFNASKAIQELGLPQTPVQNALEDAVNWFSENRYFD